MRKAPTSSAMRWNFKIPAESRRIRPMGSSLRYLGIQQHGPRGSALRSLLLPEVELFA